MTNSIEFDHFGSSAEGGGVVISPRIKIFGISKIVVVGCLDLFAQGNFLKACTTMFMVLNGHHEKSLSTLF